jgi:hypothetical protein
MDQLEVDMWPPLITFFIILLFFLKKISRKKKKEKKGHLLGTKEPPPWSQGGPPNRWFFYSKPTRFVFLFYLNRGFESWHWMGRRVRMTLRPLVSCSCPLRRPRRSSRPRLTSRSSGFLSFLFGISLLEI